MMTDKQQPSKEAEKPDRSRLKFIFGLVSLAVVTVVAGCGKNPIGSEETVHPVDELDELGTASDRRIPSTIRKPLRRILNEQQPGWQAWENYHDYGIGIWSIPDLVDNGLCWIYVNGVLVRNQTANVDGIILQSGDTLTLTESHQNGRVLWSYEVPYPNRYRQAS